MNHKPWKSIFEIYKIDKHDFSKEPFIITSKEIKNGALKAGFTNVNETEARVLAKQDTREDRPQVFVDKNLFILTIKNGTYAILEGEGYVDIPEIKNKSIQYKPKLDFELETSKIGNSEMQHLDFAYASSMIRTFLEDDSLVLTIRGRKYTPKEGFQFKVGKHVLEVKSAQVEVDAGYEGKNQVVLIEAKNSKTKNTLIRQLYYPFRAWQMHTQKQVNAVFFEKREDIYSLWQFGFEDVNDYNSIKLIKSSRFEIEQ